MEEMLFENKLSNMKGVGLLALIDETYEPIVKEADLLALNYRYICIHRFTSSHNP